MSKCFFYTLPADLKMPMAKAKKQKAKKAKAIKKKPAAVKPAKEKIVPIAVKKIKVKKSAQKKEKKKYQQQESDQKAFDVQTKSPEPKNKLVLEYIIHAAQYLLFEFITTPSGLSEWFADDVNINGNVYTFMWDGAQQHAKVLEVKENKSIRFQWTDRKPDTYFEFRIEKNELTEELSLIITDFAETLDEKNSLEVLWQGQVQQLMHVIGSKV